MSLCILHISKVIKIKVIKMRRFQMQKDICERDFIMKILKNIGLVIVCLALVSALGCTSSKKNAVSPCSAKTSATINKNSSTPVQTNATATSVKSATATAAATSTSQPVATVKK